MNEFLQMGGYGGYVWPAYIVSAVVIGGLCASIWLRGRALRQRFSRFEEKAGEARGREQAADHAGPQ